MLEGQGPYILKYCATPRTFCSPAVVGLIICQNHLACPPRNKHRAISIFLPFQGLVLLMLTGEGNFLFESLSTSTGDSEDMIAALLFPTLPLKAGGMFHLPGRRKSRFPIVKEFRRPVYRIGGAQ